MDDEREKPGPKPYNWHPDSGEVKSQGHWWGKNVHKNVKSRKKAHKYKNLLERMTLEPEFETEIFERAEEKKHE